MNVLRTVIIIIALVSCLKGLWGLILPQSLQRTVDWWLGIPSTVARQFGILMMVAGLVLIGMAVWQMGNAVIAATTIFGTIFVLSGLVYLRPPLLHAFYRPFGSAGSTWFVRISGAVGLLVAGILLAIYAGWLG